MNKHYEPLQHVHNLPLHGERETVQQHQNIFHFQEQQKTEG